MERWNILLWMDIILWLRPCWYLQDCYIYLCLKMTNNERHNFILAFCLILVLGVVAVNTFLNDIQPKRERRNLELKIINDKVLHADTCVFYHQRFVDNIN
jgi:hypothetical protein